MAIELNIRCCTYIMHRWCWEQWQETIWCVAQSLVKLSGSPHLKETSWWGWNENLNKQIKDNRGNVKPTRRRRRRRRQWIDMDKHVVPSNSLHTLYPCIWWYDKNDKKRVNPSIHLFMSHGDALKIHTKNYSHRMWYLHPVWHKFASMWSWWMKKKKERKNDANAINAMTHDTINLDGSLASEIERTLSFFHSHHACRWKCKEPRSRLLFNQRHICRTNWFQVMHLHQLNALIKDTSSVNVLRGCVKEAIIHGRDDQSRVTDCIIVLKREEAACRETQRGHRERWTPWRKDEQLLLQPRLKSELTFSFVVCVSIKSVQLFAVIALEAVSRCENNKQINDFLFRWHAMLLSVPNGIILSTSAWRINFLMSSMQSTDMSVNFIHPSAETASHF